VRPISLAEALSHILDVREKTAEISTNSRGFFVHVRVPEHVAADLREVQKKVVPDTSKHEDIDHVTLVFTRKASDDHPPERVHAALEALREIGQRTEPIEARIQGWAHFDSASKDGKPSTALVALLDAPMLEHLHVDIARALEDHGVAPSTQHGFVPHVTFAYIGHNGRVDGDLPPLSGKFTIDKFHVASRDHHEIPLTGHENIGRKAAMHAVDFSPKDNFTLSTSALRNDHRMAPGKGETSAVVGTATPQTGAMHSGGGFK